MTAPIPATLGNRQYPLPPRTRIADYSANGQYIRVSLKLLEPQPDCVRIDAQAFAVDAAGQFLTAPDGRPSRTPSTTHSILASSLGDTHTLAPGWVRVVDSTDPATLDPAIPHAPGKPAAPPDPDTNPTGQSWDGGGNTLWRWDSGELARIETAKARELVNLLAHSDTIAGLDF